MELRTKLTARSIAYLVSSLVVVTLAIVGYQRHQESLKTSDKVVAIYAGTVITEAQVQYQIALDRLTGKNSAKNIFSKFSERETALEKLKELFGYQVLLQSRGWKIGIDEIMAEQRKLKERGGRRSLSQLIQQLEGFSPQMYSDIYIRSLLVKRMMLEKLRPEFQKLNSKVSSKEWMQAEIEKLNPSKPGNEI